MECLECNTKLYSDELFCPKCMGTEFEINYDLECYSEPDYLFIDESFSADETDFGFFDSTIFKELQNSFDSEPTMELDNPEFVDLCDPFDPDVTELEDPNLEHDMSYDDSYDLDYNHDIEQHNREIIRENEYLIELFNLISREFISEEKNFEKQIEYHDKDLRKFESFANDIILDLMEEEEKTNKDIGAWENSNLNWRKLKDPQRSLEKNESCEFDESEILGHLIGALNDSDDIVRREAAISLGIIGDVRALSYLKNAFKDPDEAVQEAARDAVRKIEKNQYSEESDSDSKFSEDESLPELNDYDDDANDNNSSTQDLITRIIDENDEYMDDIISGL